MVRKTDWKMFANSWTWQTVMFISYNPRFRAGIKKATSNEIAFIFKSLQIIFLIQVQQ